MVNATAGIAYCVATVKEHLVKSKCSFKIWEIDSMGSSKNKDV